MSDFSVEKVKIDQIEEGKTYQVWLKAESGVVLTQELAERIAKQIEDLYKKHGADCQVFVLEGFELINGDNLEVVEEVRDE